MMAGRRDRRRPLIRSGAMAAVIIRNGGTKRSQDLNSEWQNDQAALSKATVTGPSYTMLPSQNAASSSQPELGRYLRQLSALHAAGVLTDKEFSAAKARLFGS